MKNEKKDVLLWQNGILTTYSVYELATQQANGETTIWIPQDRYELRYFEVTKNGHYSAKAENCDGFSAVQVNVEYPTDGVTRTGVEYEIYTGIDGKPHVRILKGEI